MKKIVKYNHVTYKRREVKKKSGYKIKSNMIEGRGNQVIIYTAP